MRKAAMILLILFVIIFVILFLKPFVIIPPGYVGVKILFGRVYPSILRSGLHIVNPLLSIKKMDIRLQAYTMSMATLEGEVRGDDAIEALTLEGLTVKLDLTA